jgi:hypothetical protein
MEKCAHKESKRIQKGLKRMKKQLDRVSIVRDVRLGRLRLKYSRSFLGLGFFQCELIGDVVFVDVADVLNGFLPYFLGYHKLDISEPLIGVKPRCERLFP